MKKRTPRLVRDRAAVAPVGIWVDPDPVGPEKVVELLASDGRVTHIAEGDDGSIVVRTDGLRVGAHAVSVLADGTTVPIRVDRHPTD